MKNIYFFTFFISFDIINDKKIGYMTILTIYSRSLKLIGEKAGSKICKKILFPQPPPLT